MTKNSALLMAVSAVILGLIAGAVLMGAIGSNPIEGYTYLFKGGLMSIERIGNTIATAITLMLTGLSVAFAFKTGLFNIGASGQMLMGGLCSTVVALTLQIPRPALLLLSILAGFGQGRLASYDSWRAEHQNASTPAAQRQVGAERKGGQYF